VDFNLIYSPNGDKLLFSLGFVTYANYYYSIVQQQHCPNGSTKTRNGVIVVSHLILNNEFNEFAKHPLQHQKLYVGKGKTNRKLNCGRALAKMQKSIPIFFDPKEKDTCIYYVGHWKPLSCTAQEFDPPKFVQGKNRVMYIELKFDRFDEDLANAIKG